MKERRRSPLPYCSLPLILFSLAVVVFSSVFTKTAAREIRPIESGGYRSVTSADTTAVMEMISLAQCVHPADIALSNHLLRTALHHSRQMAFARGAFQALLNLAANAQFQGDYQTTLAFMFQSEPYALMGGGTLSRLYINIGMAYSNLGKYSQALHYLSRALSAHPASNTCRDSVHAYINTGTLWTLLAEQDQALHYFVAARDIAIHSKDSALIAAGFLYTGDTYYYKQDLAKAIKEYEQGLWVARKKAITAKEVILLYSLAMTVARQGDYTKALGYLAESGAILKTHQLPANARVGNQMILGIVYLGLKDYAKAKPILMEALAEAKALKLQETTRHLEPKIAELYNATGQYKEAYDHLLAYNNAIDTLMRQEKLHLLSELTNARIAEKDKAMLAQQLFIARQKSLLQQKNYWIGTTIAGLLLLIGGGVILIRNHRHRQAIQQSTISQLQQKQEINQLKAQMRGEELERERIAHELHDGIASQLWAIKLNMDSMQNTGQDRKMQEKNFNTILQQLHETTQDVRRTAHNMLPDLLLQEGLSAAIASVCDKTSRNTRLEVDFQEYGQIARIDHEIELSIYRMVQELIQNVMKHALDATYLLVQLSCAGPLLNITIEDNGSGVTASDQEGTGLQQIRKRAHSLKGHFDFKSVPGKGTTAYLEFDLRHLI